MNKKMNTMLFILGATVYNVIVAVLSFIILIVLFSRFIASSVSEAALAWSFSLIFIAAIAISFIAYRFTLKFLMKKIDFEKYFDPIFARRHTKKPGS
jgi:hypothetical protein